MGCLRYGALLGLHVGAAGAAGAAGEGPAMPYAANARTIVANGRFTTVVNARPVAA